MINAAEFDAVVGRVAEVYGAGAQAIRGKVENLVKVAKFPAGWIARAIEDVAEVGKKSEIGWGLLRKILQDYRDEGGPPPPRKSSDQQDRIAAALEASRKKEAEEVAKSRAESLDLKRKEREVAEGILAAHAKRCEYPLKLANIAWRHIAKDDPRWIEAEQAQLRRNKDPWLRWFEAQSRDFTGAFKSATAAMQDEIRATVTKAKSPDILLPGFRKMLGLNPAPTGTSGKS